MFVAYANAAGVIGFCHEAIVPAGVVTIGEHEDLNVLTTKISAGARHAKQEVLLVPGVPEADDSDSKWDALLIWVHAVSPGYAPTLSGELVG